MNVVARESKIGWFERPGKFSKEIVSRKGESARIVRKGKRVLRVFVDCKIDGYPDLMQPLRNGNRKETAEGNL